VKADQDYILKTFEFKLRVNKAFVLACEEKLDQARFVYNCALEHRKLNYQAKPYVKYPVNFYSQSRELTEARALLPEVKACLRTIQSDALEKLDAAFQAFFKRVKEGQTPGFPRFVRHEVAFTTVVLEKPRHNPVFRNWFPTGTCVTGNYGVRSFRDNQILAIAVRKV